MNLKYLGYAGIILPILGATYGGLMIASDLEIKLNGAYDMAQDAHNRIDQIDSQVDGVEKYAEMLDDEADRELESSLDKIDSTIYMMNEQWTFKEKEFNRQIAEMAGRLALIDGIMSSLEKKSYDAVSLTQMDGLREQIFSLRDKIEEANRITGPDPIQEIYQLRQELEDLREINDQLIKSNPKDLSTIYQLGINIKNLSLNLYVRYHKNFTAEENEFLLQCAATGSEAAQKYKDAVDYFLKAQRKFPESDNAPIYLHNRARILDNILLDKNNARLAFEELIELYPDHPLSENSKVYLDNVFGKSNEELINILNSKN